MYIAMGTSYQKETYQYQTLFILLTAESLIAMQHPFSLSCFCVLFFYFIRTNNIPFSVHEMLLFFVLVLFRV